MNRGKFIVFEGVDGCGKTTQVRRLHERINAHLRSMGAEVFCAEEQEPYSGDITGGVIRSVLSGQVRMPGDALAYLYAANRLTHISRMVPRLEEGNHIVCDRYYFSNFAYNQTQALGLEDLIGLNRLCMERLQPDAVFYLRISQEEAARRRNTSRLSADANDKLEKQLEVARNYEAILERFPDQPIFAIDCDGLSEEALSDKIWQLLVDKVCPEWK